MRRSAAVRYRVVQFAAAVAISAPALAQNEEPSLDFLEYLGSWEDGDESWYVEVQIEEADGEQAQPGENPSPKEARLEREDD